MTAMALTMICRFEFTGLSYHAGHINPRSTDEFAARIRFALAAAITHSTVACSISRRLSCSCNQNATVRETVPLSSRRKLGLYTT
jgi:hypothetical protein